MVSDAEHRDELRSVTGALVTFVGDHRPSDLRGAFLLELFAVGINLGGASRENTDWHATNAAPISRSVIPRSLSFSVESNAPSIRKDG